MLLDLRSVSKQRRYPTWFGANPADFGLIYATTGAIGIFNPAHAAFTPTWFSVR